MILPITLTIAGAAALINIWLAIRVVRLREAHQVLIGDGDREDLSARMRAHANFVEYTPFVLILLGAIELAAGTTLWLWAAGGIYLIGRILHAFGMDGRFRLRMAGAVATLLILLGLALYAIAIPYLAMGDGPVVTDIDAVG